MSTTVIKSATVQITQDASIVFNDDSTPTVKRGGVIMASDRGQGWEDAARAIAAANQGGLNPLMKVLILDGGLGIIPRILNPISYNPPIKLLYNEAEVRDFVINRYAASSWSSTAGYIVAPLSNLNGFAPFDFIFCWDLSFPITPAQLQPYAKSGTLAKGVYYPGGFLVGTGAAS